MTDEIERFEPVDYEGCQGYMEPYPQDGDYVRYSDHLAAMQAKDARIAELERALNNPTDTKVLAHPLVVEMVEVLEYICEARYGLQSIIEDGGGDEERARYYCNWVSLYQSKARATLARIRGALQRKAGE